MTKKNSVTHVNITFKNTDATDALKQYANEKITRCADKFTQDNAEIHVVLSVEKKRQIAEASFNHLGSAITATEESEDMYKSIDLLVDTLATQLRKQKERVTSHH
jgi:putative sigma-54 modulation protein